MPWSNRLDDLLLGQVRCPRGWITVCAGHPSAYVWHLLAHAYQHYRCPEEPVPYDRPRQLRVVTEEQLTSMEGGEAVREAWESLAAAAVRVSITL